jgi:peptidoglycan/LPS O-acetylase OafA/YrhL
VLLTHWGGWTIAYADSTTEKIIVFFQYIFELLLWKGGGIHPGVIIFIVLSGFCIHLPQALMPDKLRKSGFWRLFILKRSIRILPVFWVALFLGVISVWLIGIKNFDNMTLTGGNVQIINSDMLFSILGVSEIARFFGVSALYPGNGPLTTVAVEILLYAIYPFLLFLNKRYGLVALVVFGLLMYSIIILSRFVGIESTYLHGTWFEFVIYWIIGAVSAEFYVKETIKNNIRSIKLSNIIIVTYLCYLALISFLSIKGLHVVTTLLLALLTGGLLVELVNFEEKLSPRQAKIVKIMAKLGKRSYSLYVVHTPVIFTSLWFLSSHTNVPIFSYSLAILIIVFIATELMYRFVENPTHHYARKLQQKKNLNLVNDINSN